MSLRVNMLEKVEGRAPSLFKNRHEMKGEIGQKN